MNLLNEITSRMKVYSETASLDARLLLSYITGRDTAWLLAHPEIELKPGERSTLELTLADLEGGTPLPYVIGHWEFYGLDFKVSPQVLIPRPETELLVEKALTWLASHPGRDTAMDIGTGSGCIAVSLAVHVPRLHLLATDLSAEALQVAGVNASRHKVADRIRFVRCNLFPTIKVTPGARSGKETFSRADLVVANLPYIPSTTLQELPVSHSEHSLALDGGEDGLTCIREFLTRLPEHLLVGGLALVEIEATQGEKVLDMAYLQFPEAAIDLHQDLAGRDRLLEIGLPE